MPDANPAAVRVTIHLPGNLRPGDIVVADLNSTYVQQCLAGGFLVVVPDTPQATDGFVADLVPPPVPTDGGSGDPDGQYRKQDDVA